MTTRCASGCSGLSSPGCSRSFATASMFPHASQNFAKFPHRSVRGYGRATDHVLDQSVTNEADRVRPQQAKIPVDQIDRPRNTEWEDHGKAAKNIFGQGSRGS